MPSTRRTFLTAVVAAVPLTAGCALFSGSESSKGQTGPYGDIVLDYEQSSSTTDGEQPLYRWTGEEDRSEQYLLVSTDETVENLDFQTEDTTSVERALERTDFETTSALLVQRSHTACHSLDAFEVIRRPDEVKATLCRQVRPADTDCSTDRRQTTAMLLRLPFATTPDTELSVARSSRCWSRFGPQNGGVES